MKLDDLRGWMAGTDCVVVGCGPSADTAYGCNDPIQYGFVRGRHWTIACNRAVIRFPDPDFVVCVEPRRDATIWNLIREYPSLFVFSHIDKPHPRAVLIGSKDVADWLLDVDQQWVYILETAPAGVAYKPLRLGQSPFYAASVATLLGFETIGLIGVDLTEDRYPDVSRPNEAYGRLAKIAEGLGSRIVNLSPKSRLDSIPKAGWEEIRTK